MDIPQQYNTLPFLLMCSVLALDGCSERDTKLELAANALEKTASECLLDVRDRKLKYESAPNCTALGTLSAQYVEAGGFDKHVPDRIVVIAERALKTAWMARAVSASGGRWLTLW